MGVLDLIVDFRNKIALHQQTIRLSRHLGNKNNVRMNVNSTGLRI